MASTKHKIELSDRQMIVVWTCLAWFQVSKLATGSLVRKFYPDLPDKQYKLDKEVEDRIIEVADFIKREREART